MGAVRIIALLAVVPSCYAFFVKDKLELQQELQQEPDGGLPIPGFGDMIRRALWAASENKTLIEKSRKPACKKDTKVAMITWRAVTNKRKNCMTITVGDGKTKIKSCRRRGQKIFVNAADLIEGETVTEVDFSEKTGSGAFLRATGDIESGPFIHAHDEIQCPFCGKKCVYPSSRHGARKGNGLITKVLKKCPVIHYQEKDTLVSHEDSGLIEALPENHTKMYFTFAAFKNKNEKVSKMFAMVVTVSIHCPEHEDGKVPSIPRYSKPFRTRVQINVPKNRTAPNTEEAMTNPEPTNSEDDKEEMTNPEPTDSEDVELEVTNPEIEELLAENEDDSKELTDNENDAEELTN